MYSTLLFRPIGGIASVISGLFLASAHLINLIGGSENGTVLGQSLVLLAHLGLCFAFIGLFEVHGKRNGLLGNLGMIFGMIGTIFVTAVVFVEIAGATGVNVDPIFNESVSGIIYMVGPLFFVVGLILVGISVMKEGILPRIGGLCLIVGTFVFALASLIPSLEAMISFIGGAITGIGFVWLGGSLLSANGIRKVNNQSNLKA